MRVLEIYLPPIILKELLKKVILQSGFPTSKLSRVNIYTFSFLPSDWPAMENISFPVIGYKLSTFFRSQRRDKSLSKVVGKPLKYFQFIYCC